MPQQDQNTAKLYKSAFRLAIFTVVFNILEGLVSVYFGLSNDTLSLFGFGLDSFIETISAIGIVYMIIRIRENPEAEKSGFEITALKITGWCFYGLSFLLVISGIINLVRHSKPSSTVPGVIITIVSIIAMWCLISLKKSVGRQLNSDPIIADANCNLVCIYMSVVVLLSSSLYEIFKVGYIDLIGTAGIIYFSVKEGIESFKKAKKSLI
jgi:divalent metal cation (Fe/Co/Zn/Cd) transporter